MVQVALVDYGAGNLASVRKALRAVGAEAFTPASPDELERAQAVVVPGVGHFSATAAIGPDWRQAITRALAAGRPLLGICLGMQWLYEGSAEAPDVPGLGVLKGTCALIDADRVRKAEALRHVHETDTSRYGHAAEVQRSAETDPYVAQGFSPVFPPTIKVPHVGWNAIDVLKPSRLLAGVATGAQAYFTHSYAAPITADTTATTSHGETFASAVERGHVYGVQFHPEKSGDTGLALLANFVRLAGEA